MATETDGLSFGPFHLIASERLLKKDGVPLTLGSKALDILTALVSSPGEVVSKKDLMALVWPEVVVDESSLRFHMAKLRRAIGDGKDGARYISTLPGRGYCFVAQVSRANPTPDGRADAASTFPHANLPGRLPRMVGRDEDVVELSARLSASRFVTIVGAGGVGKTTVAIAVGHHLIDSFAGAALFVDLGTLSDPALVATAVASMLGLSVRSNDATQNLVAYLRARRVLLILDTCEHLVEAVAALASRIIDAAAEVYILATSREALRVANEHIYRLNTLECPPDDPRITVALLLTFPAAQLFVERAAASGARLAMSDADAVTVSSICRTLDGVALAIELAARHVDYYGVQQTAALLDQRVTRLWRGSRTAPARQQTLQATLEWSFGLLTALERVVLRRLATFVGHFTLDAALEVVTSATFDRSAVLGAIDSLIAKSIVSTYPIGTAMRYRLLDTTRAYVLELDIADPEGADLAVRHAAYFRRWLELSGVQWSSLAPGAQRTAHFAAVDNVRAALEWCFGPGGNVGVGVGLAAAAAPVFLAMSLLPECLRWSQSAVAALDETDRGGLNEMQLQAALGVSSMFSRGGDPARVALERSLAIAEARGGPPGEARLLASLYMFHLRAGNFATALDHARRGLVAVRSVDDPVAVSVAHHCYGISLHLAGDLVGARAELEASMNRGPRAQPTSVTYVGFESTILANAFFARNLWLQGYPHDAITWARRATEEANAVGHPLTLAITLIWAISVFLWIGDLKSAVLHIESLVECAEANALEPYLQVARGLESDVRIRQGDFGGGVDTLFDCLQRLHAAPYEILTTELNLSLVQGLAAAGRADEASTLIEESLSQTEAQGNRVYVPELLRVKGTILLLLPEPRRSEAEACLRRALELSVRHGARAWQLRAATDLARLMNARGESRDAHALLQPISAAISEGQETADVQAAAHLLATLAATAAR